MPSAAPQREERERHYYIITFNRQHIVHMQPVRLLSQRMWTVIRAIAFTANHFKFTCVASGGAQRRKKDEEPKERENYLYTQNNKNTKCYIRRRRRRCEWRTFVFTLFKVCTIAMCACAFVWHTAHNSALDSPHLSQSRLHFIEFVFLSSFFFCSAIIAWITASGEERSEDQFWRATWKQSHATIPAISLHSNIYVYIELTPCTRLNIASHGFSSPEWQLRSVRSSSQTDFRFIWFCGRDRAVYVDDLSIRFE